MYFTYNPGQMTYSPTAYEEFSAYVYVQGMECYVSAAEFMVALPAGVSLTSFDIPEGSLSLGSPDAGVAITYWPPLNGYYPGYNYLCTLHLLATRWCTGTSSHKLGPDAPATIVASPESGLLAVTCWPENFIVPVNGLTSYFCPDLIGTHDRSWGAIKSLYE